MNLCGEWITRNGIRVNVSGPIDSVGSYQYQGLYIAHVCGSPLCAIIDKDGNCEKDSGYDLIRRRRPCEDWKFS